MAESAIYRNGVPINDKDGRSSHWEVQSLDYAHAVERRQVAGPWRCLGQGVSLLSQPAAGDRAKWIGPYATDPVAVDEFVANCPRTAPPLEILPPLGESRHDLNS